MVSFSNWQGADTRIRNKSGDTALSEAIGRNHTEIVDLLMSYVNKDEDINNYFGRWSARKLWPERTLLL